MNLIKRLEGIVFSPKQTFAALAEKPVWVDALVIILIALAAYSLVITPYAKQEQVQVFRDSAKLKATMGEERFNQRLADMDKPTTTWGLIQAAGGLPLLYVIGMLVQCLFFMILGRLVSTEGKFKQVFAALVHANLINGVLGSAVRTVLTLAKKSAMQVSTGLPLLFPKMEVMSKAYIVLGQVDFFQIWTFGVLAFGLAAAFKINVRKALFLSFAIFFLSALFNIAYLLLIMSFVQ
jgi:hypothetical protein